jgi:hypothetical protein
LKALPCKTPGCNGHPQLPGVATLHDSSPYLIGRAPANFPYGIHCSTCKQKTWISRTDWNLLPDIQRSDIQHITPPEDSHHDFKVMTRSLLG